MSSSSSPPWRPLAVFAAAVIAALAPTAWGFVRADTAAPSRESAPAANAPVEPLAARGDAPDAGPKMDIGVQFHGVWSDYSDHDRAAILDQLVEMGATWVRVDISWAGLEPDGPKSFSSSYTTEVADKVIAMAHERGLKVLGMLWLTPPWADPTDGGEYSAPADEQDYADALSRAASRWSGQVQAWEVWNEPNLDLFFDGASPRAYTRLLCSAYDAVQRSGSSAQVVFSGTVHNDVDWIRRAYDAGAKGCFDVMATHPYGAPSNAPPSAGTTEIWDLGSVVKIHDVMNEFGDRRPIWATELGWSSHANTGDEENWMLGVTEQQQADYTVEALRILQRDHPYVTKTFIYNAREKDSSDLHQNGFGIIRRDLTPKPVYWALKAWIETED